MSFVDEVDRLLDVAGHEEDSWEYGLGLWRPARQMKLPLTLKVLGIETMGRIADGGFELAKAARGVVEALNG
jgi:hypothetical protein